MKKINAIGVIPARIASKRFPEKVIQKIIDKPLIYYVYNQARQAKLLDYLIVATDSQKVVDVCERYHIPVLLTSSQHRSGTDRVIEVSRRLVGDVFVNIQGDEPLIQGEMIDQVVKPFLRQEFFGVATLKKRITDRFEISNPNVVKVVTNINDEALYFSRLPIPYSQQENKESHYKHIGLYGYSKSVLDQIACFATSNLELAENLEQLRFMDNGVQIKVYETEYETKGVDTKEDLIQIEAILKKNNDDICSQGS